MPDYLNYDVHFSGGGKLHLANMAGHEEAALHASGLALLAGDGWVAGEVVRTDGTVRVWDAGAKEGSR